MRYIPLVQMFSESLVPGIQTFEGTVQILIVDAASNECTILSENARRMRYFLAPWLSHCV